MFGKNLSKRLATHITPKDRIFWERRTPDYNCPATKQDKRARKRTGEIGFHVVWGNLIVALVRLGTKSNNK